MRIRTHGLAKLISAHGVKLHHYPPQPAAADMPWTPEVMESPSGVELTGIIQHIRAETNPRLPAGSMKAVAVLKLNPQEPLPRPGEQLRQESRIWTIETILPLMEDRHAVLVEAVLLTSGEAP
ncbi:hypothetical protein AB8880_02060 [Alphaproteobacteria bacterium LSUCC0684]